MSETLKHIELIESYSEGRLNPEEKMEFEKRLVNDKELRDEVDLYKEIVEAIKVAGEENLKAKLKIADQELDANALNGSSTARSKTKYWAIAASVFFVLGTIVLLRYFQNPSLGNLADEYYEKEKGLPVQMSPETNALDPIMNSYKNSDYVAARNALQQLMLKNSNNDTLNFFLGVTLYELGDFKGADKCFVQMKPTSSFYQKSQYRELLVFLKLNNKQMVKKYVNEILNNKDHLYYEKVVMLGSELAD